MRRGEQQWSRGVREKGSNAPLNTPALQYSITPAAAGFALYEVLIGVTIFVIGVIALGHAVENCLNASTLSAEEDRVRQILSNRMAEIQTTPGIPDAAKELKIDTGYGVVQLLQKTEPAKLKEEDGTQLDKIRVVTLTAKWTRGSVEQSRKIEFYVYRAG